MGATAISDLKRGSVCPTPSSAPRLTAAQMNGVRQGWNKTRSKGLAYIGGCIFKSLCNTAPEVNLVFLARHCNVTAQVELHAKALGEMLDMAVKNLEDLSQMDDTLMDIGRMHQNFQSDGLTSKAWDKLSESMIEATIMWGLRGNEMQKAWVSIILYLIEKMKLGYTLELRNKRASICPAGAGQAAAAGANALRRSSLKGASAHPTIAEGQEPDVVFCQPAFVEEVQPQSMSVCQVKPKKPPAKRKPKPKA